MAVILDLFGDEMVERAETRGRPPHVPTQKNRNRVNMLLAMGWTVERIAAALCITAKTLRKHYLPELKCRDVARDRLDMRRAELLWQEAEKGNVGAMKEFGRFLERSDMLGAERAVSSDVARQKAPERIGKKVLDEQLARDADADLTAELDDEAGHGARH